MKKESYTLFGNAVINGYNETVYLTKSGFKKDDFTEDDLVTFATSKEAFEYAQANGHDLADTVKVSEVF